MNRLFFGKKVTFSHFSAPFSDLKAVGLYGSSFSRLFFREAEIQGNEPSLFFSKGHFLTPKRPQNGKVGDFLKSDPQIVFTIVIFQFKSYYNFDVPFLKKWPPDFMQ